MARIPPAMANNVRASPSHAHPTRKATTGTMKRMLDAREAGSRDSTTAQVAYASAAGPTPR